jgi:hypothetical protein
MEADFPAAHSMDTVWFAVDADGHVAYFHSGENGCVPVNAGTNDNAVRAWLRTQIPGITPDEDFYPEEGDYAEVGLFTYGSGDCWRGIVAPYEQGLAPVNPLHIDQVPPFIRDVFKRLRFDGICFRDAAVVQPLELGRCHIYDEDENTGYLVGDGVTVRPVPGQERHFLQDYEQRREEMQQYNPALLQRLRFELPRKEDLPPDEDEYDEEGD